MTRAGPAGRPDGRPERSDRPPTWRLVAAITLPVTVILVIIALAAYVNSRPVTTVDDPLPVSAVEAPGATTTACSALSAALPDPLAGLQRRQLVDEDDPTLIGVAAWGEPAIVLRCGTPTPQELTCTAPVQVVNGVAWLPLTGSGSTTYLAVDRAVRVALTVPDGTSTGPWQEMSRIIGSTLPARDICLDGEPVTPDGG